MYKIKQQNGYLSVRGADAFSAQHTFENGQCFRWHKSPEGGYIGVAGGRIARVWDESGELCIETDVQSFESFWADYLDIGRDYAPITKTFPHDDFTKNALIFGDGLRILRQEPWEALCSFIISQCNNISRIKKNVDALCRMYGDRIGESDFFAFPTPERLAALPDDALCDLRLGYRAPYVLNAARQVAAGNVDFEYLKTLDLKEAEAYIMRLEGVGRKVADCFLLFGMGRLDAFPVDTWMKKAAEYYPNGFDSDSFGQYAGVLQQFIFYFVRSNKVQKTVDIG